MSATVNSPVAIASYCNLAEPRENLSGNLVFSVALLFDKKQDLSKIREAAERAGKEKFGNKWEATKKKPNFKWPFRDGDVDKEGDAAYAGKIFINVSNRKPVGAVGPDGKAIDISEVYSGCRVKGALQFSGYDKGGGKGVGAYIVAVQKVADGERLDGAAMNPEGLFDAIEEEESEEYSF